MKSLLLFCLLVLLAVVSCKKDNTQQDLCVGVVCLNGGHCEDGVCVCAYNWQGTTCNQQIIPVDSFVGDYHMIGIKQTYVYGSGYPPPEDVDDTISVVKINDSTLQSGGVDLVINTQFDTLYFAYENSIPHRFIRLSFHRPFTDDSAFHYSNYTGSGGSVTYILSGKKLH